MRYDHNHNNNIYFVIRKAPNPDAPFQIESENGIKIVDGDALSANDLLKISDEFKPELVYVAGWSDKRYLKVALKYKQKDIPVITGMDNHWLGTAKQKLAGILSPWIVTKYFTHIWIPGIPQYYFATKLGFKPKNILRGLYCADENIFTKIEQSFYTPKLTFIGRLVEHKGLKILFEVLHQLINNDQLNFRVHIIGSGPLAIDIPQHANIIHTQFLDPEELPKHLSNAGFFILPSLYEAWGVVVHEAVLAGLPLIASNQCGAASEFLINGFNGYKYDANNQEDLYKILSNLGQIKNEEYFEMSKNSKLLGSKINAAAWSATLNSCVTRDKYFHSKPTILIFIDWFLPGYKAGGPIQSIANFIHRLKDELDISVVTSNTDLGEKTGYPGIKTNQWIHKPGYRIMYLNAQNQNLNKYKSLVQEQKYHFIYFNSLFSIKFTLLPYLASKKTSSQLIMAPRGMLGAGALAIKKRKKQLFLEITKQRGYFKNLRWHATANTEADEIKQHFGQNANIRVAPNLSATMGDTPIEKEKHANHLNLFFLSRIATKKNLLQAILYLNNIETKYLINFTIFGPIDEAEYWLKCQKATDTLPSNIQVAYKGYIPNQQIKDHLLQQHFLLLPTMHENFGHAIMESWQNACPVIISDQTPWQNLQAQKTGWAIPLHQKEQFIAAIESAAQMNQTTYSEWSKSSWQFAKNFSNNPELISATKELFS